MSRIETIRAVIDKETKRARHSPGPLVLTPSALKPPPSTRNEIALDGRKLSKNLSDQVGISYLSFTAHRNEASTGRTGPCAVESH
mmetsp:Transcript_45265/g.175788  ORF Transcript_45265/g.175788 Transcript_45265/m.175788 type:complete len:85 (+) Transcript_45265:1139-1393(+)